MMPQRIQLVDAQVAGRMLSLHPRTVLRWAREGKIPCHWLSARALRFDLADLRRWLTRSRTEAHQAPTPPPMAAHWRRGFARS